MACCFPDPSNMELSPYSGRVVGKASSGIMGQVGLAVGLYVWEDSECGDAVLLSGLKGQIGALDGMRVEAGPSDSRPGTSMALL